MTAVLGWARADTVKPWPRWGPDPPFHLWVDDPDEGPKALCGTTAPMSRPDVTTTLNPTAPARPVPRRPRKLVSMSNLTKKGDTVWVLDPVGDRWHTPAEMVACRVAKVGPKQVTLVGPPWWRNGSLRNVDTADVFTTMVAAQEWAIAENRKRVVDLQESINVLNTAILNASVSIALSNQQETANV